jgi:exopolysaccharide biosynthesis protein
MKKIWLLSLTLISLGMSLLFSLRSLPPSVSVTPRVAQTLANTIRYEQRTLPQSIVHILWIPAHSRFVLTPALSPKGNTVEEFAQKHRTVAILNAGFFDPVNQKSTSYVVLQGKVVADPKDNDRLVNNPNLKPYLNQIFNRAEFRHYLCGQTASYDIVVHSQPAPGGCQLVDAVGAGPGLLPEISLVQEGFVDQANGRDALGSNQPNARTAVGITRDGSIILLMVAQKPSAPTNSGLSLPAIANLMKSLGVNKAMNLDGGSSSSLYYNGKSFYGKVDLEGNPIKRPVKSVLLVQEN